MNNEENLNPNEITVCIADALSEEILEPKVIQFNKDILRNIPIKKVVLFLGEIIKRCTNGKGDYAISTKSLRKHFGVDIANIITFLTKAAIIYSPVRGQYRLTKKYSGITKKDTTVSYLTFPPIFAKRYRESFRRTNGTPTPISKETPLEVTKQPLKEELDTTDEYVKSDEDKNIDKILTTMKVSFNNEHVRLNNKTQRASISTLLLYYEIDEIIKVLEATAKMWNAGDKEYKLSPTNLTEKKFNTLKETMENPTETPFKSTQTVNTSNGTRNFKQEKIDTNKSFYENELKELELGNFTLISGYRKTDRMYGALINYIISNQQLLSKQTISFEEFKNCKVPYEYWGDAIKILKPILKFSTNFVESILTSKQEMYNNK